MAEQSLAVKYRPTTFNDVSEQESIKTILTHQLSTGTIKNAYLFCGGAGTGKTTCGRIFANEINHGKGAPVEIDAASNNSVDDVRQIIQQSKTQSLDSEYRVWIIDECHSLSNNAWQAFLKILEEPPKKSVFIFCTTNPERIPKTILSRVQRYDFKRISQQGIVDRLRHIIEEENKQRVITYTEDALQYLSRLSDGGMRDAITLMDKCLAYSEELTVENVVKALGTVDYETFIDLTCAITRGVSDKIIRVVEGVHADGKDLKQFIKDYMSFILDVNKYDITDTFEFLQIPSTYEERFQQFKKDTPEFFKTCQRLLSVVVKLNADIKWDTQPKVLIEAVLLGAING